MSSGSLDFAKAHISAFYDSDFFPKSDEFDVLWKDWRNVKSHLSGLDTNKLPTQQPRAMPAPKVGGGYRMVHQLEPLDAIVYTALAHSVAGGIEAKRPRAASKTVFSYRVSITTKSFFGKGSGYKDFVERCTDLASVRSFVLVADIADFYNRVYLHRLNSNIAMADARLSARAQQIERFISNLNDKASQGLPVGPAASIILSEAVLLDLDRFIADHGLEHCRYVDDIRVFSDDCSRLEGFEEELVSYLYHAHRLQLSAAKTVVLPSSEFKRQLAPPETRAGRTLLDVAAVVCDYGDTLTDADIAELKRKYLQRAAKRPRAKTVGKSAGDASSGIPVFSQSLEEWLEGAEAHDEERAAYIQGRVLTELLGNSLKSKNLDLGLARYALRHARLLKVRDLLPDVLRHFGRFGPVLPELFLYLREVITEQLAKQHMVPIRQLAQARLFSTSRLARHWAFWFFTSFRAIAGDSSIATTIRALAPIEFQARAAGITRDFTWLRANKSRFDQFGRWDRRAFLLAWKTLPKDERNPFLKRLNTTDPLERWIIQWAQGQP